VERLASQSLTSRVVFWQSPVGGGGRAPIHSENFCTTVHVSLAPKRDAINEAKVVGKGSGNCFAPPSLIYQRMENDRKLHHSKERSKAPQQK
ncbi:hypothetical protein QQP08_010221, partial [Theobroma cacao]